MNERGLFFSQMNNPPLEKQEKPVEPVVSPEAEKLIKAIKKGGAVPAPPGLWNGLPLPYEYTESREDTDPETTT